MENTERWKLLASELKVLFWVSDVLPLSVAHSTFGKIFGEVFDFTDPTIAIDATAKIVSAISEPTGTTLELSMA